MVHETLSRTVERLDILLFGRTTRHEAHIGLLQRRADRLRVVRVVLLAEPEGLHVLRTYDSQVCPNRSNRSAQKYALVEASIPMMQGSI